MNKECCATLREKIVLTILSVTSYKSKGCIKLQWSSEMLKKKNEGKLLSLMEIWEKEHMLLHRGCIPITKGLNQSHFRCSHLLTLTNNLRQVLLYRLKNGNIGRLNHLV